MKEKNLKLIMELIFIFILPLLFILPCISINNNYVYDNNGNYQISSKKLSYSNIGFSSYYKNYLDFNQYIALYNVDNFNGTYNGITRTLNSDGIYSFNGTADSNFYGAYIRNFNVVSDHKYLLYFNGYVYGDTSLYQLYTSGSISFYGLNYYRFFNSNTDGEVELRLVIYNGATVDISCSFEVFDLTQMFGSGYEPSTLDDLSNYIDLSTYHDYTESNEIVIVSNSPIALNNVYIKSFISNLKDLLSSVILIDSNNVVFNLVLDYTVIWFIMFAIWHLFYTFIDFIVHLARIRKRE